MDYRDMGLYELYEAKMSNPEDMDYIIAALQEKVWGSDVVREARYSFPYSLKVMEWLPKTEKIEPVIHFVSCSKGGAITSFDFIRKRINHIYNLFCEERHLVSKEDKELLQTLYDAPNDIEELKEIKDAVSEAYKRRRNFVWALEWEEYCLIIGELIEKTFKNMRLDFRSTEVVELGEYGDRYILADDFIVKYINTSLYYEFLRKYRERHNIPVNHKGGVGVCECGRLFPQNKKNNRVECDVCRSRARGRANKKYYAKRKRLIK